MVRNSSIEMKSVKTLRWDDIFNETLLKKGPRPCDIRYDTFVCPMLAFFSNEWIWEHVLEKISNMITGSKAVSAGGTFQCPAHLSLLSLLLHIYKLCHTARCFFLCLMVWGFWYLQIHWFWNWLGLGCVGSFGHSLGYEHISQSRLIGVGSWWHTCSRRCFYLAFLGLTVSHKSTYSTVCNIYFAARAPFTCSLIVWIGFNPKT